MDRYQFDEMPQQAIDVMDLIAKNRSCMRKGGIADLYKVSEIVLNEFRSGTMGEITLETVALGQEAKRIMEEKEAEREANKDLEPKKKKRRRR